MTVEGTSSDHNAGYGRSGGLRGANRSDFEMFAVVALEGVKIATRLLSFQRPGAGCGCGIAGSDRSLWWSYRPGATPS
jgi:hypothetical protein